NLVGEIDRDEGNVLETIEMDLTCCGNCFGVLLDQMINDRKVVRSQVPNNINIVLEKPQVHAGRIVIVDLTQGPILEQLPDFSDRTRKQECGIHHQLQILSNCEFYK